MGIFNDIKDFFFPRICVCCGKVLNTQEEGLCLGCISSLPLTGIGNSAGNEMEKRFWGIFPIERATSLFYYSKGGLVADVLYGMKYHGRKNLCFTMGKMMGTELLKSGFFDGIDCIVPVPLHKDRLRQRGYNQSGLLSEGLSFVTGIPVSPDIVVRTHNNATQTHKSGFERWMNAGGLFVITDKSASIEGKHILIIDDVLTTGATISSCIDTLRDIKGIKISVATLAWAK